MKRCPTCDKTFADGMRFCQTDGTVLIDDALAADPYKTMVSNQSEIPAPPVDSLKTMVASPSTFAKDEDDVLQSPEEPDAMKTMIFSQDELKSSEAEDVPKLDMPPPSPYNPSAPLIEPSPSSSSFKDFDQESSSSKPSETSPSDATAVMDSDSFQENATPKFDSKPFQNDFSQKSPYGNQENKPIPSPFQDPLPSDYQSPYTSPFEEPKPPIQQSESMFGGQPEPASQSPFGQSPSFGQPEPFNPPMQHTEWTPPPAPVSEWQNQDLGANQSFQPSGASVGQNQTLAIVSLVCGILSMVCCFSVITGPAGLITGFMAKNKADQDPAQFGGRGLALAGMITGGIGTIIGILVVILQILGAFAGRF
ncbi:MAG: DUF4190 domain-containing protein [Acidobacteriota bacterium]|nr:DUF4190 domain-containing protein [Acidobacteriota bacterium]